MSFERNSIILLKDLFDKCNGHHSEDSDSAGDEKASNFQKSQRKSEIKTTLENPLLKKIEKTETSIQSYEELEKQVEEENELIENLKTPEYRVVFKQSVAPEDVYLQLSGKTPATFSCEDMILQIEMPDETVGIDEMNLVVEEKSVKLRTKIYLLNIPLSQKVDKKKSKAEYDSVTKQLNLTMRINREFDFFK
jgi:dynein assembly factor 6, axonemal